MGEWRSSSYTHSLISALDVGGVSFTPRPLYPTEKAPGFHWIGGWVGLKAGLDTVVKRKIPQTFKLWTKAVLICTCENHQHDYILTVNSLI
jgi:hypothetical protein